MNRLRQKLTSQSGASITYALLLFLVCSVLCSVILAAATSASGRMSGIAENDQRYYAVTSAADVLQNIVTGETVSIVKKEHFVKTATYKKDGTYTEGNYNPDTPEAVYVVALPASEIVPENIDADSPINSIPLLAAKIMADSSAFAEDSTTLNLTGSAIGEQIGVTIETKTDKTNGNIQMTVYNTYDQKGYASKKGNRYTLVLTFGADRSEEVREKEEVGDPDPDSSGGNKYTVDTHKTKTTITSLSWNLIDIKQGGG